MSFSTETINKVWQKAAHAGADNEKKGFRKDQCGAWIRRADYGDRDSDWGWEIDHIKPQSKGGGDELSNLRPLHWQNNVTTNDGRLKCPVTAKGNKNI